MPVWVVVDAVAIAVPLSGSLPEAALVAAIAGYATSRMTTAMMDAALIAAMFSVFILCPSRLRGLREYIAPGNVWFRRGIWMLHLDAASIGDEALIYLTATCPNASGQH